MIARSCVIQAKSLGWVARPEALRRAWSPNADVYFGLNTVSWSLACEVFFYASFPLLNRVLARLPERRLWTAALIAMGVIWLVPVVALLAPERF